MNKTLVVARYNEDVGWANIDGWKTTVVTKGLHLPNVGRESLSYLWYIIVNYDHLDGLYCFSQGRINDQIPHLPEVLGKTEELPEGIKFVYTATPKDHGDGTPLHPGLDVRGFHKELLPNDKQPDTYTFYSAACFIVTADKIKEHSLEFYHKAFVMHFYYHDAPWVIERLWHYIFKEDKK